MDGNILLFVVAGFFAQIIDGTLGMAYGVSCSTLLLTMGVSPVVASASVHLSELFTTASSGFWHWRLGNVDKDIIKRLIIPGVIGGITGAYLLVNIPGEVIKPIITLYLLGMGVLILTKAFKKANPTPTTDRIAPLGFVGGFVDAVGGGGWGSIVTASLVARGQQPRFAIGSVNLAEFFVTAATSATFICTVGITRWDVVLGLIIGGVLAGPVAAVACRHLKPQPLMVAVGIVIIGLSLRNFQTVPETVASTATTLTATLRSVWK